MAVRLSLIRDPDWDETARARLASDSKQLGGSGATTPSSRRATNTANTSSIGEAATRAALSNHSGALQGISARTEWHERIGHAWAVESVPRGGRFDDTSTTGIAGAGNRGTAATASSATTPFRSSVSGLNQSATKNSNINNSNTSTSSFEGAGGASKYVAICLGTQFTQELCRNPPGSLPVHALTRMRNGGSGPVSVLCNVAMLLNQNVNGSVTMRDLTAQLVPEETMAEVARYNASQSGEPQQTPFAGSILEESDTACRSLQLPSSEFRFVRCGAEAYGTTHISTPASSSAGGGGGARNQQSPFVRGDSQLVRLSLSQRGPDAAMLESLIESLAESESFASVMGKTTIVFSLYDENTHSAAQVWFVSDGQLPFFGANVAGGLFTPGLWSAGALSHQSSLLLSSMTSLDSVIFSSSALLAQNDQFDRILGFSIAAAAAMRAAIAAAATSGGGASSPLDRKTAHDLIQRQQDKESQQLNSKRSQLLKVRQQHEQQLAELQHAIQTGGTASERLAAERQYQRLLMGELELLEHRVEEVKQLTDQERSVMNEIESKHKTAAERVDELEEQKGNLVREYRSLTEETRSSTAVAEALQTQVSLLEQRLAAASASIVNYRSAQESRQRQAAESHSRQQRSNELSSKHEMAMADAQRHFSEVQRTVADDTRDAEEAHKQEMKSLQHDISTMQRDNDTCGSRLGEMRANLAANEALRKNLEKEYDEVREAMHSLLQGAPELAATNPSSVLDERRDKLSRSVAESKETLAELRMKLDEAKHKRDSAEEQVLSSERLLQRILATTQLKIPPQLEAQRENLEEEEYHARRTMELETEAGYYVFQNNFYLSMFDRVHRSNASRHRRRHEELRLELDVADEKKRESVEKLKQAQAVSDVFAKRMEECNKEQLRLRDEHKKAMDTLRQQLLQAESEPVERVMHQEVTALRQKITQTTAEIDLLQGAMLKAPSGNSSGASSRSGSYFGGGSGSSASQSIIARSLSKSATTFAGHRSLRASAPVPHEVRERLKLLRRESYRRCREENAKASELEQRLEARRRELTEKSSILSTMRGSISDMHEQLQLRTEQIAERNKEMELLRSRDQVLAADLEEELEFAQEIANRHKNENRLQLTRVAAMIQEQETELSRSRHEVAKLEKARNDIVRRMSQSNEQTLLMELEHEQRRREELREQLSDAGIAASPPSRAGSEFGGGYSGSSVGRGISSVSFGDEQQEDDDNDDEDNEEELVSVYSAGSRHASVNSGAYYSSQPRHGGSAAFVDPTRASPMN